MSLDDLKQDGLLLQSFENPTLEMCLTAVKQNVVAFQFVPPDLRTPEIIIEAFYSTPHFKSRTFLNNKTFEDSRNFMLIVIKAYIQHNIF